MPFIKTVTVSGRCAKSKLPIKTRLLRSDLLLNGNWEISVGSVSAYVNVPPEPNQLKSTDSQMYDSVADDDDISIITDESYKTTQTEQVQVTKIINIFTNVCKEFQWIEGPIEKTSETLLRTIAINNLKEGNVVTFGSEQNWFQVTQKEVYLEVTLKDGFDDSILNENNLFIRITFLFKKCDG